MCWEPHLEVEVRGVVGVEVLHPQQHLLDEEARLLLRQSLPLSDEVEQLAAAEPAQGVMCNAEFIVARMCVNSLLQSDSAVIMFIGRPGQCAGNLNLGTLGADNCFYC